MRLREKWKPEKLSYSWCREVWKEVESENELKKCIINAVPEEDKKSKPKLFLLC